MIKQFGLLSIGFLCIGFIQANGQQRKYVNEFLNLGVGARGIGMAGSQVASVNDVHAAFWNPAGLNHLSTDLQFGGMHSEYFSSIAKFDYLGSAFKLKNKKGVMGLSFVRFAIDDIPYTINMIEPDGSVNYSKIKSISAADYAGLISYARPITLKRFQDREDIDLSVGGNFKVIHRTVGSLANAWGAGIDLGAQARIGLWKLGVNLRDITTTYTMWSFSFTEKEKQEFAKTGNEIVSRSTEVNTPRIILGGARTLPIKLKDSSRSAYLLAELNLDISTDGKRYGNLINLNPLSIDPKLGLEFGYNQKFFLRGGLGGFQRVLDDADTSNTKKRTMFQPSLGLGVMIRQFNIDYAFSSLNVQGNPLYSHFISLQLSIRHKGGYGIANSDLDEEAKRINKKMNKK